MKVLIVDDSPINLKIAKKIVEQENCNVEIASSGFECLDKIKDVHYDLILMDIMMPTMDGVETFNRLKEVKNFDTPVVTLTAINEDGSKEKYLSLGFNGYLSKPLDREELKKILSDLNLKLNK